jgi:hypothetical protein
MSSRKSLSQKKNRSKNKTVNQKNNPPKDDVATLLERSPSILKKMTKKLKKGEEEITLRKLVIMMELVILIQDIEDEVEKTPFIKRVPTEIQNNIQPAFDYILKMYKKEIRKVIESHALEFLWSMEDMIVSYGATWHPFIEGLDKYEIFEQKENETKNEALLKVIEYIERNLWDYMDILDGYIVDMAEDVNAWKWFEVHDLINSIERGDTPKNFSTFVKLIDRVKDAEHHGGRIFFGVSKGKLEGLPKEKEEFKKVFTLLDHIDDPIYRRELDKILQNIKEVAK